VSASKADGAGATAGRNKPSTPPVATPPVATPPVRANEGAAASGSDAAPAAVPSRGSADGAGDRPIVAGSAARTAETGRIPSAGARPEGDAPPRSRASGDSPRRDDRSRDDDRSERDDDASRDGDERLRGDGPDPTRPRRADEPMLRPRHHPSERHRDPGHHVPHVEPGRPRASGPLYAALDLGTNNCRLLVAEP
jgi:exopolyphosphatase/guanosine-5'-triphosphate,3'-diphosphate pyrophosphatase